jgi:hypothetical protein
MTQVLFRYPSLFRAPSPPFRSGPVFSQSPDVRWPRRPSRDVQGNFVARPSAAPVVVPAGLFSESPYTIRKPSRVALERTACDIYQSPSYVITASFADNPLLVTQPMLVGGNADAVLFPPVAAFLGWGMFSESPVRTMPAKALLQFADISFLQIVYTPSDWDSFSESPYTVRKPSRTALERTGSDDTFLLFAYNPLIWPFSESQYAFKRPSPLQQFADIAFLQIVYTPGPLAFAESPRLLKASRPLDQPGFVPFIVAATLTPSFFPWTESPILVKSPIFNLRQFNDFQSVQIVVAAPTVGAGMFAESSFYVLKIGQLP